MDYDEELHTAWVTKALHQMTPAEIADEETTQWQK